MIPVACSSILVGQVGASFLFERNDDGMGEDKVKTIVKFMNTMVQLPNMKSRLDESLAKLLETVSYSDVKQFEKSFTFFLTEFYEKFIQSKDEQSTGFHAKKLTITYEFIDCILQYIKNNADKVKEMHSKNVQTLQVFYKILYWPLSLYLHRNEVSLLTVELFSFCVCVFFMFLIHTLQLIHCVIFFFCFYFCCRLVSV